MTFFLEQEGVALYLISFLLEVLDQPLNSGRGTLTPLLNLLLAVPFLAGVSPALALVQELAPFQPTNRAHRHQTHHKHFPCLLQPVEVMQHHNTTFFKETSQ